MSDDGWLWKCDHTIPSKLDEARTIQDEILRQLEIRDWNDHDRFAVHLAMEESLVNAIRHGNKQDPAKRVWIRCRLGQNMVRLEIINEGPGFNPEMLPDPTSPDRLTAPGGRGVMLLHAFMSRVEYLDSGRHLILERVRSQAA